MSTLLRTHGLYKRFGELRAVDGVSLELAEGVLTAIIGPNGAGKTTLINLLSGAMAPDSGRVEFRGHDVTRMPVHARVRHGLTRSFQIMSIFAGLTVRENVLIPVLARLGRERQVHIPVARCADALGETDRILEAIGLLEQRDRRASALSHGDKRRLELGIAIASEPVLCLLDEPCSGTNPVERRVVLNLIQALSRRGRTTFVVVEHDMDVVFSLAQRIVVMSRGQVLADGPPPVIRDHPQVRAIYLGEEFET
ncbi:MAG: ABC transporter ATP-binding protein [Armatimonadota bacterium]|nr:ABC transporter ATP-binding protein [Armatimonadota bacterium]MDR5698033.1 ABC transporter ATP-binding protein [Armatimonadota bacterium]